MVVCHVKDVCFKNVSLDNQPSTERFYCTLALQSKHACHLGIRRGKKNKRAFIPLHLPYFLNISLYMGLTYKLVYSLLRVKVNRGRRNTSAELLWADFFIWNRVVCLDLYFLFQKSPSASQLSSSPKGLYQKPLAMVS